MHPIVKILLCYLAAVNLLGACAVFLDKWKAKHGRRRIRERTLFLYCWLGGCPLTYAAMKLCRHKTLHRSFMGASRQSLFYKLQSYSVYYTYCIPRGSYRYDRIADSSLFGR